MAPPERALQGLWDNHSGQLSCNRRHGPVSWELPSCKCSKRGLMPAPTGVCSYPHCQTETAQLGGGTFCRRARSQGGCSRQAGACIALVTGSLPCPCCRWGRAPCCAFTRQFSKYTPAPKVPSACRHRTPAFSRAEIFRCSWRPQRTNLPMRWHGHRWAQQAVLCTNMQLAKQDLPADQMCWPLTLV